MEYQVKLERVIARPVGEVFEAVSEGRLFANCSAHTDSMKIDFRVGGKYNIEFKNHGVANFGEFLEIIPNKKIVFSWCQTFGEDQKPDTTVTIQLFEEGAKTRLVLAHTGFKSLEIQENHRGGWENGVADLGNEMELGRLRMVRRFSVPVEALFAACKNPELFFGAMGDLSRGTVDLRVGGQFQLPTESGEVKGEFLKIISNKEMSFSWLAGCTGPMQSSRVSLVFEGNDKGGSTLKLVHDGLATKYDQKAHRSGWEAVLEGVETALKKLK